MKEKYEELRARYEAKAAQMHRLQVQNVSLLNMAASGGNKGDADHVKRLEELLQVTYRKNTKISTIGFQQLVN